MTVPPLIQGSLIGLSIAAPVGPIGVLCIRRSLAEGWGIGLATGLGAAVADSLYGSVAAFGLSAVTQFLAEHGFVIGLIGGLFLCLLGIQTWRSTPADRAALASGRSSVAAAFGTTVLLTLANPATLLSFTALCAGFGIGTTIRGDGIPLWITGVFLGSAAWWLFLSGTAARLRHTLSATWMKAINRLSGAMMVVWGIAAVLRALSLGTTGHP